VQMRYACSNKFGKHFDVHAVRASFSGGSFLEIAVLDKLDHVGEVLLQL
jgi:hypothetical protein